MFEQPINQTIQRISRDILGDRTLIPLAEIADDERVDRRLTSFFENEVHWWIYAEATGRRRDRRFDYDHPELASLLDYIESVQTRHARFDRSGFLRTLESGVKLGYNYLCRPQTTLKWFVFRGEPTKPLGETLLRMDAFVDYPYFAEVFTEWVERKRSERPVFDAISSREFERIIRRIDDQILLSCTIDELLAMMEPLFSLEEAAGSSDGAGLPIEVLIVFFDDKKISKLVEFLEGIAADHPRLTRETFASMIERLLVAVADEPEADFSSVYQEDALDAVVREHLAGDPEEADGAEVAVEVVAEEQGIEEIPDANAVPDFVAVPEVSAAIAESEAADNAEEVDEVEPAIATGNIRSRLGDGLSKKIVKKVFDRDRKAYAACLDEIDATGSWREASALLDALFSDRDVDPYSKTAIRFTDAVYGGFIDRTVKADA